MDFRIKAFVGPITALRNWRRDIPSAVVAALTDELGLVPVTEAFRQDLRSHLGAERQSEDEVIQLWGAQASGGCTIAYISADYFEDFYSDGIQYALAWTCRQAVQSGLSINDALRLLGVKAEAGQREFNVVDLSRHPDTESWAAAAILIEAVSRERGIVPALIQALRDRGSDSVKIAVRLAAAAALGGQGTVAKVAIPALAECARTDTDLWVRQEAIRALGLMGRDAIPALIELLRSHRDMLARSDAAAALGDIGSDAREAIPALIEALHERDEVLRLVTARALGRMYVADRKLKVAFQALVECATTDPSSSVRVSAVRTLAAIGPEAAPVLVQVLKTETDRNARKDAAAALEEFGNAGSDTDRNLGKGCP